MIRKIKYLAESGNTCQLKASVRLPCPYPQVNKIIAITQEANIKSCQLLQTIGMEYIKSFELFNAQQCMYTIDNKLSCISIDKFITDDIPIIISAFNQIGWNKPVTLFERYLKEQEAGERLIWVAHFKG